MKINQHLIGIARDSSRGIFLTDRCSGAFLIHVVRAALLAVVLSVIVVLVSKRGDKKVVRRGLYAHSEHRARGDVETEPEPPSSEGLKCAISGYGNVESPPGIAPCRIKPSPEPPKKLLTEKEGNKTKHEPLMSASYIVRARHL
jgi:hypothetical protein